MALVTEARKRIIERLAPMIKHLTSAGIRIAFQNLMHDPDVFIAAEARSWLAELECEVASQESDLRHFVEDSLARLRGAPSSV